jgi:hypothetical protein
MGRRQEFSEEELTNPWGGAIPPTDELLRPFVDLRPCKAVRYWL